jgi:flagellar basal-body rod protein FlgF
MMGMIESVRGALKEELRMDLISNNLANATTIGFKKDRVSFQNFLVPGKGIPGDRGAGLPALGDPALVRVVSDLSQGEVLSTGNELDFTIGGKGFFKVMTPEGVRYTRKGNFTLDRDGYLCTQEGFQVMGKGGPIHLWGDQVQVDVRGNLRVEGSAVDALDVVDLSNPERLVKEGSLLFRGDPDSEEIPLPPDTTIKQGYLEGANVQVAEEMVNMIHCMRAFESYQKAIQVLDKLDAKATNEVGRLR